MSLPIIDFYQEPSPGNAINHCLSELGFMQMRNFGIDMDLLQQVFLASKAFFAGDDATKARCAYRSAQENFGYQGLQQENLDPRAPADLKETFTMRNILNNCPAADRWPSRDFMALMQDFYAMALEASFNLQRAMALHLGEEEDFFTRVHKGENITLRLLHYPAHSANRLENAQLGAGAHTDYGFLTLLFQDKVSGLQVLNQHNEWMDVPPQQEAVVINSGDLLERWSNGQYRSTLHRVRPPIHGQDRLSIALFLDPDSNTCITPLRSFVSDAAPAKYKPITAGEHIQAKIAASHKSRFTK